jgi:adenylate cyclase
MAIETERKFLLRKDRWNALPKPESKKIKQGYITTDPEKTIRIRIKDEEAFLTIKGKTERFSRTEIECKIPVDKAEEMLSHFAATFIEKERFEILYGQRLWEIDVFHGANEGLIIAEIELENESAVFEIPEWVDKEVTDEVRYYNSYLSLHPFNSWA